MILAAPALRMAVERGVQPWFVTYQENAPALALTGQVPRHQVFTVRNQGPLQMAVDAFRLLRWIHKNRLGAVLDLELFARLTAALSYLTGARWRIGFHSEDGGALYRGHLLTNRVTFDAHQHMSVNYLRLVAALFGETDAATTQSTLPLQKIRPNAASAQEVSRLLDSFRTVTGSRLVLVNANASDRLIQRRWPLNHFSELIEELLAIRPDVAVLLIGGINDRSSNRVLLNSVRHYANSRCFDIAGQLPIDFLPALFARSAVMVTNDSGPAHFAAVSDLPVVVLFGPETPALFGPLGPATIISANLHCSPCISALNQRRSTCQDNQCMRQIPVQRVLDATLQRLASQEDRRRRAFFAEAGSE